MCSRPVRNVQMCTYLHSLLKLLLLHDFSGLHIISERMFVCVNVDVL